MSGNKKLTRPAGPHYVTGGYQPGSAERRGLKLPGRQRSADQAPPSKPPSNPPNRGSAGKKPDRGSAGKK